MNYRETEGLYYSKCLRGKYTESSVGMGQGLGPCAKSFGRDAPSKYGKTAKNGQKNSENIENIDIFSCPGHPEAKEGGRNV